MNTAADQSEALRRAALQMAIEYHANNAQHRTSKGPAPPTVVTSTATQFYEFLASAAERAGVTPDKP